jgi:hypothetical protein
MKYYQQQPMTLLEGRHLPCRTNAFFRVDEVHVSAITLPVIRGYVDTNLYGYHGH